MKQSKLRQSSILLLAAVLLLAALFSAACSGPDESEREREKLYNKAVELFEKNELGEAKEYFARSKMYADSDQYVKAIEAYEKLYLDGVAAVEAEDYATAYSCFGGIPKYLNSKAYLEFIDGLAEEYAVGRLLYEQGQYLPARASFIASNGYGESAAYIENIDAMVSLYNTGVEQLNRGSYQDAIAAFTALNTRFEDSDEMLKLCRQRLTTSSVSLKAYIKNYNEICSDAAIDAGHLETDFTLRDTRGVLFSGETDENGIITRIDFGFTASVRDRLGEDGMTAALTQCIRALNPFLADDASVRDGLYAYLSRTGAGFGSMWVRSISGSEGSLVIEVIQYIH